MFFFREADSPFANIFYALPQVASGYVLLCQGCCWYRQTKTVASIKNNNNNLPFFRFLKEATHKKII